MTTNTPKTLTDKVIAITLVIWLLFFGGFGQIRQWISSGKPASVVQTIGQGAQQMLATAQVAVPTTIQEGRPTSDTPKQRATPRPRVTAPRPQTAPAGAPAVPTAPPVQPTAAPVAGQPAPQPEIVVYAEKPVDRQPAGEVVPIAEPLPQNTDAFGTKAEPVDIQATHECRHGQVWTESGCKNPPTP